MFQVFSTKKYMCGDYKVCNVCNYSYGNVHENELDARHEMTCAMFITLAKKDNISSAFFFFCYSECYLFKSNNVSGCIY